MGRRDGEIDKNLFWYENSNSSSSINEKKKKKWILIDPAGLRKNYSQNKLMKKSHLFQMLLSNCLGIL